MSSDKTSFETIIRLLCEKRFTNITHNDPNQRNRSYLIQCDHPHDVLFICIFIYGIVNGHYDETVFVSNGTRGY